ncbi:hypothetical protein ESCO_005704 [Escovopsis weberi]|uniref:Copper transport protein n=1 Tax=Escovopsis weberi TaxID=150374 RepID=A0A0M8MWC5_ESCWE|nr:hypothetical protein ESCO_005704 [Escovopsis weberi]
MDMDMNMGPGTPNSSSSSFMAMAFSSGSNTPLYSSAWTPASPAAYAGTCIFLILLALLARLLVAFKARQEARWLDRDRRRRYVRVAGKEPLAERLAADPDAKHLVLAENGVEERVVVVERREGGGGGRPWRFSVDPVRAALDTTIVGIGYLLMLAVMTMNVGYFISVLGGVFLGSLAVGRYSSVPEH